MGAAFRRAVLTGVRRSLNRVVEPRIRCHDVGRMTFRTESPAEEATTNRISNCGFRISQFAIWQSLT